jgi:DNA-binding transcriptional ArsR family regulator
VAYGVTLGALADPTRRRLYERLRRGPRTVTALAGDLGVSQPAVSQHLTVLRRARLVTHRREGTRRFYQARQDGLADLRRYLESLWDDVLAAYAAGPGAASVPRHPKAPKQRTPRSMQ